VQDCVFAHFVRETMFALQDLVLDTADQASRLVRRDEVLLIAWDPIVLIDAQQFFKSWPQLVSTLAANVSMGDLQARANEGFRTCFQVLHVEAGLRHQMIADVAKTPIIPPIGQWRWRRVCDTWVSLVHNQTAQEMMADTTIKFGAQSRGLSVFIFSRSTVRRRHVVNEEQLRAAVASSAYVASAEIIVGERVPFWDLAATMWHVSVLVGAEGAWAMNAAFCRPWTPVLLLLPPYRQSPHGIPPHLVYPTPNIGWELAAMQMNVLFWRAMNAPLCPGDWGRDCHTGEFSSITVDIVQFDAAWRYTRRLVGRPCALQPHVLYDDREDHVAPEHSLRLELGASLGAQAVHSVTAATRSAATRMPTFEVSVGFEQSELSDHRDLGRSRDGASSLPQP
jgi:hypothetical protein